MGQQLISPPGRVHGPRRKVLVARLANGPTRRYVNLLSEERKAAGVGRSSNGERMQTSIDFVWSDASVDFEPLVVGKLWLIQMIQEKPKKTGMVGTEKRVEKTWS